MQLRKTQILFLSFTVLFSAGVLGQPQNVSKRTSAKLDLVVVRSPQIRITLRAENIRLQQVATRLAEQLNVPIVVSPKLKLKLVTLRRAKAPLETFLKELAPQVYVDYLQVSGEDSAPRCQGIFLFTESEDAPMRSANVRPRSQAFLITGDTEEITTPANTTEDLPLQVLASQGLITVNARRQPLTVVLYEIASNFKIPFEMRFESKESVNLAVQKTPLQDALPSLPAGIQYYYRLNLNNLETTPLHLLLASPMNKENQS
jgi:hypothetical protein